MPFNPDLPDDYFRTGNLIAEWDKLSFAPVSDQRIRTVLEELREHSLNHLIDPPTDPADPQDYERHIISAYRESLIDITLRAINKKGLIQPHWRDLCEQAIALAISGRHADTTLAQRREAEAALAREGGRRDGLAIEFIDDDDGA